MEITNNINDFIFRGYDLRGVYPTDIDENVAYTIGKSYGSYIQELGKTKCVVGHDNRFSSNSLTEALILGIMGTGVDVTYLGLCTTPMYYYACIYLGIPSGVMVTASHNPKDENGFKIAFDERGNARGEMINEFKNYTKALNFKVGQGKLTRFDIKDEYFRLIENSISLGNRRLKVVIDCANATTSYFAKDLYSKFNIDLDVLFGKSDPSFPNHHPDPSVESNMEALKKRVVEIGADVGIGFDGDGDRVGIVDELGNYIPIDKYMIIIIRDLVNKVDDKRFLYDVKCSKALEDEIVKLGATPIVSRTGNSYTKAGVIDNNLKFGGEFSGHVFFNDKFPGFDSGMYGGLRLIEILSKTDKSVSQLLEGINKYYSTNELKFASRDDLKFKVIDEIKNYAINKGYKILDIDGVKILFDDGWALVRASNTGPNITARFEASTNDRLKELEDEFIQLIKEYNV